MKWDVPECVPVEGKIHTPDPTSPVTRLKVLAVLPSSVTAGKYIESGGTHDSDSSKLTSARQSRGDSFNESKVKFQQESKRQDGQGAAPFHRRHAIYFMRGRII